MKHLLISLILLFGLNSCYSGSERKESEVVDQKETLNNDQALKIDSPKLLDYNVDSEQMTTAIDQIIEHLKNENVPVDSMYLYRIDTADSNGWEFELVHYNHFVIMQEVEINNKRVDSLEKAGVDFIEIYAPPTGNWGGHDRTIIYSPKEKAIIEDYIVQ